MPNPSGLGIRSYGATNEYRSGYDRIFGGKSEPATKALDAHDLLRFCGDDAAKWAEAFKVHFPDRTPDAATLVGWFANAIEHSGDVRRWRAEKAREANAESRAMRDAMGDE